MNDTTSTPMYAHKEDGLWSVSTRPKWFYDGEGMAPVSDEYLAENGYYRLSTEPSPKHNPLTHEVKCKPKEEWEIINNVLTPTYIVHEYSLEEVKFKTIEDINRNFTGGVSRITYEYPEEEQLTWATQQQELALWKEDVNADIPMLTSIAISRGVDLNTFCQKVSEKIEHYKYQIGHLLGLRQKYKEAIEKAETVEEVLQIHCEAKYWPCDRKAIEEETCRIQNQS